MVKSYNKYLVENVQLSLDMIVDIIQNSKDEKLINRLLNYSDKAGKTILMSIVQSNRLDLIDVILGFDVDVNSVDKFGRNVLFYCKNKLVFEKFYDFGVNVNFTDKKTGRNLLSILANKKIFDVKIYQEIINSGVDINKIDNYDNGILCYSIGNLSIVTLLIKNGVDVNMITDQRNYLRNLLTNFNYKSKRNNIIKIFKLLFENGLEIKDIKHFSYMVSDLGSYTDKGVLLKCYKELLSPLSQFLTDDMVILLFRDINDIRNDDLSVVKYFLDFGMFPKFYKYLKKIYGSSTLNDDVKQLLSDYKDKYPYINDIGKYNL